MGSLPLTLCTGLLACVAGLSPAAAHAADGQGVTVSPASPAPGSVVALRVSGCSGTTGSAASTAFVSDARLAGFDGALTGEAQVRSLENLALDARDLHDVLIIELLHQCRNDFIPVAIFHRRHGASLLSPITNDQ